MLFMRDPHKAKSTLVRDMLALDENWHGSSLLSYVHYLRGEFDNDVDEWLHQLQKNPAANLEQFTMTSHRQPKGFVSESMQLISPILWQSQKFISLI